MDSDPNSPPIPYKTRNVMLLSLNTCLGCIFMGYNFAVFNPLQSYITHAVYPDISRHLIYLMTSFNPLGAAIGGLIGGKLASVYGRRKTMIWTDIASIIFVLFSLIGNEYLLLIGRMLVGICGGLNASITVIYLAEISPVDLRGITGSFNTVCNTLGGLIAYLFGLSLPAENEDMNSQWWRFMLAFSLIPAIIRLINFLLFFRYETPKYLVLSGQDIQAKEALCQLYTTEKDALFELELLEKELRYANQSEAIEKVTYKDLLNSKYKGRVTSGCWLAIFIPLSGGSTILLYSTQIFKRADLVDNTFTPEFYTVIIGVLDVLASLFISLLITRAGRKTIMLRAVSALCISHFVISMSGILNGGFNRLSVLFVYIAIMSFALSFGSVIWIYLMEILPDIALGLSQFATWGVMFIVAEAFPYSVEAIGDSWTFMIFFGLCLLAVLYIARSMKETKDKSMMEIAEMFSEKQYNTHIEEEEDESLITK